MGGEFQKGFSGLCRVSAPGAHRLRCKAEVKPGALARKCNGGGERDTSLYGLGTWSLFSGCCLDLSTVH